jgi:predicted nucleotidyltransferase
MNEQANKQTIKIDEDSTVSFLLKQPMRILLEIYSCSTIV